MPATEKCVAAMCGDFEQALREVAAEWEYEQEHGLGQWVWVGDTDHVERDYFGRAAHG